jgi:hypothetical protein
LRTHAPTARKTHDSAQLTASASRNAGSTPSTPPCGEKSNRTTAATSRISSWIAVRIRSDRLRATSTELWLIGSDRSRASTPFFMSDTSPMPDWSAAPTPVVTRMAGIR